MVTDVVLEYSFFITECVELSSPVLILYSGSWKQLTFKPLNFDAMGVMPASGYLHPLLKIRAEYRQIFLEMGSVFIAALFLDPDPVSTEYKKSFRI